MTYRMEPWVELIASPVDLIFPDGKTESYRDGAEAAGAAFRDRFLIRAVRAMDSRIEITLIPSPALDGEETFF